MGQAESSVSTHLHWLRNYKCAVQCEVKQSLNHAFANYCQSYSHSSTFLSKTVSSSWFIRTKMRWWRVENNHIQYQHNFVEENMWERDKIAICYFAWHIFKSAQKDNLWFSLVCSWFMCLTVVQRSIVIHTDVKNIIIIK